MHSSRMRTGRSLTVYRSLLHGGDVSAPRGVSAPRAVCLLWGEGVLLLGGGVSSPGVSTLGGWLLGGHVCSGGMSALGGLLLGDVCSWGVWYPSMHQGRHPPPVNRMTNRCKNITLATTALRPVKIKLKSFACGRWF